MRKLILKMSMSLDGFVSGPNNETDWIARNRDEGATAWIADTLKQAGLHAMGSRTYTAMANYWPTATGPLASAMNGIPKIVFTRQPSLDTPATHQPPRITPGWTNPQVANGDLATEIANLKAQDGRNILAHGGAAFARSLASLGLIDEYRLLIHPVALGAGLPLFADLAKPLDLTLVSTSIFRSGVAAHIYQPA